MPATKIRRRRLDYFRAILSFRRRRQAEIRCCRFIVAAILMLIFMLFFTIPMPFSFADGRSFMTTLSLFAIWQHDAAIYYAFLMFSRDGIRRRAVFRCRHYSYFDGCFSLRATQTMPPSVCFRLCWYCFIAILMMLIAMFTLHGAIAHAAAAFSISIIFLIDASISSRRFRQFQDAADGALGLRAACHARQQRLRHAHAAIARQMPLLCSLMMRRRALYASAACRAVRWYALRHAAPLVPPPYAFRYWCAEATCDVLPADDRCRLTPSLARFSPPLAFDWYMSRRCHIFHVDTPFRRDSGCCQR